MLQPQLIVIAGPNGSGKSTAAPYLLPETLAFINADDIAAQLAAIPARNVDLQAGRIMLKRLDELEQRCEDFALETTLAGRSLVPRITRLRKAGYWFHLIFLWLPSADLAVERVAERVRHGGHNIPEETVRRRFKAGINNFFNLYRPLADTWRMYNNSRLGGPELIAAGQAGGSIQIHRPALWSLVQEGLLHE